LSVHRSSCPLGSHAWILIAMFHLAMDLASCQPLASGAGGRLSPRPALRHRLSRGSLWGAGSGEELRRPGPPWTCTPRGARSLSPRLAFSRWGAGGRGEALWHFPREFPRETQAGGRAAEEQILWRWVPSHSWGVADLRSRGRMTPPAPTAPGSPAPEPSCPPGAVSPRGLAFGSGSPSLQSRGGGSVCGGGLCSPLPGIPLGSRPHSLLFLFSAGLAVHQIITITVSLIMVIAALITTLVLKNCCAQSGRPRRNSHQRKLDQQEESCQNLTDFAPARVPSALDIFTAYNETLQCSHECVRTPVPVYAEEALHSPGDYKTTFNGNRPSSSDRHLIPVAFVSEKWFEISC
ncbi:AJAP1 protein, partial [Pelecanoides urinatrix]|nr:AJAP1 protein [Pelecanoides urinatrix]